MTKKGQTSKEDHVRGSVGQGSLAVSPVSLWLCYVPDVRGTDERDLSALL